MAKRTATEGWASAHVADLIEEGIASRMDGHTGEFPVSIDVVYPEEASFKVRFEGPTRSEDKCFVVTVKAEKE